jgi:hypothetical protein
MGHGKGGDIFGKVKVFKLAQIFFSGTPDNVIDNYTNKKFTGSPEGPLQVTENRENYDFF